MNEQGHLRDEAGIHQLFNVLQRSSFRRRFQVKGKELEYLREKGLDTVLAHGREFLEHRMAPALPANDGKQTPYRNHPIFVSQHATATCCRGCLAKWHGIPKGKALEDSEIRYILLVLRLWLERFLNDSSTQTGGNDRPTTSTN
jgi:hypothetical protein